ncbi:uncharacterized protein TNIN_287731 [Trichonephila inaurata madagascariensis]|uniref:Uncharacterized protein n=1 Tax=Trichonephila inaurata madagascariensis TaxID=2747483 RepID=A0A8X7CEH6_9ARAC|nr:uncharacterized protein TNIN_287731 [Trichonephila inaurata madagascariensis]
MKYEKGFRGVFTSDLLPKKMRRLENGIINLDIATGPGTHWVRYYNDPSNNFVEYLDPFGEHVYEILPNIKKYLQSSGKNEIGYISSFLQHPASVKCGYFCMKYISERNKGFEPKVYDEPEQMGKFIADLCGGNDNIYIHCDIAEGACINGSHSSNVIYSFTNGNRPGSQVI